MNNTKRVGGRDTVSNLTGVRTLQAELPNPKYLGTTLVKLIADNAPSSSKQSHEIWMQKHTSIVNIE